MLHTPATTVTTTMQLPGSHSMQCSVRDYALWRGYHDVRPEEVSGQYLALGLLEWPDPELLEALQRQACRGLATKFSMEDTRRSTGATCLPLTSRQRGMWGTMPCCAVVAPSRCWKQA